MKSKILRPDVDDGSSVGLAPATSLSWVEASPFNGTSVTATWTPSTSTGVAAQAVSFFSDGSCGTSDSNVPVSATSTTQTFTGVDGNTYSFKVTTIDSSGQTSESTCSPAMVLNVNVAPVVAAACANSIAQDTPYACSPSVTDGDATDSHTWSLAAGNTCAWASINASTGAVSGTANDDQVGSCDLVVKANDGAADSNELSTTITVTNVLPILTIADTAVSEDAVSAVVRDSTAVQASEEGYGLYSLAAATGTKCSDNGSVTINATSGAVTYSPSSNFNGTCNINVSFDDGNGGTVSDEFTVTVNGVNDTPVASAACATSATEDTAYSCSPAVADADATDTHTWTLAAAHSCAWLSINASTGEVSGTPTDNQVGTCTIALKANDGTVDSNIVSSSVTVNNVQPTLSITDTSIAEDAPATVIRLDADVAASDEGFGVYSLAAATGTKCSDNGTVSIHATTGAVTYAPASNFSGTCNISVQFDDQNALNNTVTDEFQVTVTGSNDAPVASATCLSSATEDAAYSCSPSVTDADTGNTQTWSLDGTNTCAWASINSGSGAISGTPTDDQVGSCTLAFKSNDGTSDSNVLSFNLSVANVTPTLSISDTSIPEDAPATVIRTDADVAASDEGFGVYSLTAATAPRCSDNGTVSINATTGAVTYAPTADYTGICNVQVMFDDQNATGSTVVDEFAVTVTASNDSPVIAHACANSVNHSSTYSCSPTVTDVDSATHTWSFTATNDCAWAGINSATGAIAGTPNDNQVGSCTLAFKANDGVSDSNNLSFVITINNVIPTLSIADTSVAEDAAATVIRGDADVQSNEEGYGTYALDNATTTAPKCSDAAQGSVSINAATGAVTYTPAADYTGVCNIKVSFDDGNGGVVSDEFAVTVSGANDAPVISAACGTSLNQDSAYSCTPSVTDADIGNTQTWSFAGTHTCAWMSINSGTGAVSGTPDDDDVGSCTLAFKSNDATVDSNTLAYTVTVNNIAPTLTIANAPAIAYGSGNEVVRDDAAVHASEEGFGTYALVDATTTAPKCSTNGVVTINSTTGAVSFDPVDTYTGICNIKVAFDDGNGGIVSDEFTAEVGAQPNGAPVISATCSTSATEDTAYSCSPSYTDVNAGDTQTWSLTGGNTCAWASINSGTGAVSGTPNDDQVGSCTLAFKSNDGTVDSNILSFNITVSNITPTLTIADTSIAEDAAATVIRNDAAVEASDEGFGTYTLIAASGTKCSDNGTVSINSTDGDVTYTPAANFAGACNINVQFDDGNALGTVTDEFVVTVSGSNDAPVISQACTTTATEDSAYSCSPSVSDNDAGDTQTWALTAANTCTWASINSGTGTISGTPNDDQVGSCNLVFKSNDGTVDSNTLTVAITISNVAPILTIADTSIAEDALATVIRNDADVQASDEGFGVYSLILASGTKCSDNGTVTINASTGAVTYQPTVNYSGVCNIAVQFDDQNALSNTVADEFAVTVSGSNDAPVISATCANSATEDVAYSCSPSVADADTGNTQTWSLTGSNTCAWASINSGSGAVSGTPNDDQVGSCTLAFKANDGTVDSNELSYAITVNNVAPTLSIAGTSIAEDSPATVIRTDGDVQASDEGYGVYSLAIATGTKCSDNGTVSINASTGAVTYQPTADYVGTCNINVAFDDQNAANNTVADEFAVTVTGANDAPVVAATCATSINQGTAYSCSPSFTDADAGDTQTWSTTAAHTCAWLSINSSSGAITGTANDDQVGTCTLAFKSNDATVDSNTLTFAITVNNVAPTLSIADTSIAEDALATVIQSDAAVEASEEGYGSYALDNAGTTVPKCNDNGTLSISAADGDITFQPAADYNGVCNVKVTFDDGNGGTVSDEFALTVNATNDAPVISHACGNTVNEDASYSCSPSVTDPDSGSQTWVLTAANTCSWAGINGTTGAVSGTPTNAHVGSCTLALKANDGAADSNTISFAITISNIAPTLTIADATVAEDAAATVIRADAEVQASDEGQGTTTYSLDTAGTTAPKCSDNGTVSIDSGTGAVTYTPAANYAGVCNVKVSFADGNGGSISDEFAITVTGSNDAPVISATCSTSLNQDSAYSCSPSVTDNDAGDTQTWSFAGTHTCGWMSINSGTGAISGTPDDDDVGTCTLAIRSNDATVDSNTLTYAVTVNNVAPTMTIADAASIPYASAATEIRNDAAVQANEEGFGTYALDNATAPKCSDNGTLSINATTGAVSFDPNDTYSGTCSIKVTFSDGNGGTVSDEFNATVGGPPNTAPTISATCATAATEDTAYSCAPSVSDPDAGDTHTWAFTGANTCAWATINSGTGAIGGSPNDNQVGSCTLAFRSNDGTIDSNILSYNITVANVAPTLTIADPAAINEDSAATVIRTDAQVAASDEGFGTYSIVASAANGCGEISHDSAGSTFTIDATTGEITFTPAANFYGTCDLDISFNDGNTGGTVTDSITVTVTNVADPSTISAACSTTATQGTAYSCAVTTSDADCLPSMACSYTMEMAPTNTCAWASGSNDSVGGTPNDDQVGTCTLAFRIQSNGSNTLSYNLTVNNVAPTLTIANAANIAEDAASTVIRNDAAVEATDEGYGTYTLIAATGTKCSDNGTVSISATDGDVTYTPAANYNGTCNINVQFDDGNGGVVSDEFAITVTPSNDLPVLAIGSCPTSINQDQAYSCTPDITDPDNVSWTWSFSGADTCAWDTLNTSTGALGGTPNDDQVGTCDIVLRAHDGTGFSNLLTIAVTINNIVPTLTIADTSLNEDAGATVIRDDAAVQSSEEGYGQYVVHAIGATTAPACASNGTVSVDVTTGAVTYTPSLNYNGICNIKVRFQDMNAGGVVDDEFAVTVNAVNDAPVLSHSCATSINQGQAYSCTPSVADVDDASFTYSFTAAKDCAWASINASSGAITGTPNDNQVGTCTLAVKANDGDVDSNEINFAVTINNVAPTLTIADTSIAEDAAATVIRDDAAVEASEEGFGTYALRDSGSTTAPACSDNGSVSIDANEGAVTYQPAANYAGVCYIKIRFNDGNAASNIVDDEFAVTVNGSNDTPSLSLSCVSPMNEDSSVSCTPTVTDPDDVSFTYSTTASHTCTWATVNSGTGAFSGTPNDDQVGTCVIAIKVNDGDIDSNEATANVTVNNVTPTLTIADVASVPYAAAATVIRNDASVQASDEGYGTYSLDDAGTTAPKCSSNGTVSIDATTGAVTFDPNNTFSGPCNIKVVFNDGNAAGSVTDEFQATVDPNPNTAPTISATCSTSATEDTAYSCSPSVSDPDAGDTQTWSLTGGNTCAWASINSSSGAISGTPTDNQVGSCTLAFRSNDGQVDSNILSYTVTVANVAPTLTIANTSINEDAGLVEIRADADVQASDEGFGIYYYTTPVGTPECDLAPGGIILTQATGRIQFSTAANWNGTCYIRIGFNDQNASNNTVEAEFTLTVNAVNDAPVISATCSTSATEDSAYSCTPSVTDPDSGATQTWSLEGTNTCAWATINSSTGAIGGTPNDGHVGACTLAFKSTDDAVAASNILTYAVNVANTAPTLTIADAASIAEDAAATVIRNDAAVQATDETFGTYTIAASGSTTSPACNSNGTVTIDGTTGAVTYTPALNYNGTCNVKVSFDDGNGGVVADEFAITVNPANDAPVISQSCATSVNHGTAYSCTPSITDPDHASHTWYISGTCAWASINSTSGVVSGTPNDNQVGTCTIELLANDSSNDSNLLSFTVTVNNVAPTLTIANTTVTEDDPSAVIRNDAAVAASDEGFGTYSILAAGSTTSPACSANGTTSIDGTNGAVTYQPAANYSGTCYIKVRFDDGNAGGTIDAEFSVAVTAVNDAPVIALGTCSTPVTQNEDVAYSCQPTVTDPDDASQTWSTTANTCAWLSINASTGALSGTPNDNQVGTCAVTFKANDTPADSNSLSISYTINNVAPTLTIADATAINEDAAATVVRNDAAVAASDETFGTYAIEIAGNTTAPACNSNGTVSINATTGAVTYTPALNYNGTCNIKVSFDDGNGGVVSDEFAVPVNAVNDAPVISATCATTGTEDVAYSCTPSVSDVDNASGFTWSFTAADTCAWDTIVAGTGVVGGTPTDDQVGTCTIAFQVTDGTTPSSAYSVSVTTANVAPTLTIADSPAINEDAGATVVRADADVAASDEGFGTYSIIAATAPDCAQAAQGSVSINASTGAVTYTPALNYNGTCNIKVQFNDGNASGIVSDEFAVTVNAVNDLPTISASCVTNIEINGSYSCTPTASDVDSSTFTWSFAATDTCTWDTINSSTGEIGGTAPASQQTCTLAFVVSDGVDNSLTSSFTINVRPPPVITASCATTGTVGTAYSCSPSATNPNSGTLSWSLDASNTCAWAAINATNGAISGSPYSTSPCTLAFKVNDTYLNSAVSSFNVTVATGGPNGSGSALVFATGAELGDGANTEMTFSNWNSLFSETTSAATGRFAYNLGGITPSSQNMSKTLANLANLHVTFRLRINGLPLSNTVFLNLYVHNGTNRNQPTNIGITSTGGLYLGGGTGPTVTTQDLSLNTWYTIQVSTLGVSTTATHTLRVFTDNGLSRLYDRTLTTDNTGGAATAGAYLYFPSYANYSLDDLVVATDAPPSSLTRLYNMWPSADGTADTGWIGGQTYIAVDDLFDQPGPVETDFWGTTGAANETVAAKFSHSIPNGYSVQSVMPVVRHVKVGGGGGADVSLYYENGATDVVDATTLAGSTTITTTMLPFRTTNAAGAAWTPANLTNVEIGMINQGGRGANIHFMMVYAIAQAPTNLSPVITATCSTAGTQGTAYSCTPGISDSDGGTATWSLAGTNTCGWAAINASSGIISGTPTDDQVGTCTLAFKANDTFSDSNVLSYSVTVANVAPTLTIANASAIPYASAATIIRTDAQVQANEEGSGTYSFDHATTAATRCSDNGVLTINSTTGEVTFDPNNTYQGTCNIKVVFNDGNASNNTVAATFTATVAAPNNPPVISASCATSGTQGVAYTTCNPTNSDADGPSATWSFVSNSCSFLTINSGTGAISGTPNDDQVGACTYTFKVNDGIQDSSNTITVNVSVANIVPTLSIADATALSEDAGATVIRVDADVQASEEGWGTYSIGTATAPDCNVAAQGSVAINSSTGAVTFTPALNYFGTCNTKVTFSDGNAGGTVSDEFSVTVNAVNDQPTITQSCAANVEVDATYGCTPTVVDPDNASGFVWSEDASDTCTWLNINASTGVISGTVPSSPGSCTLAFKVSDGALNSPIVSKTISYAVPSYDYGSGTDVRMMAGSEFQGTTAEFNNVTGGWGSFRIGAASGLASYNTTGSGGGVITFPDMGAMPNIYVQLRLRWPNNPATSAIIAEVHPSNGTTRAFFDVLRITSAGAIQLDRGGSTLTSQALSTNTWYTVQIGVTGISATAGHTLRVFDQSGASELYSGSMTASNSGSSLTGGAIFTINNNMRFDYDDIIATADSIVNSQARVYNMWPAADGITDTGWDGGQNYTAIDDLLTGMGPFTSDFVSTSGNVNETVTFKFAHNIPSNAEVYATQPFVEAAKVGAGGGANVRFYYEFGASDRVELDVLADTTTVTDYRLPLLKFNPTVSGNPAWTPTSLTNFEAGFLNAGGRGAAIYVMNFNVAAKWSDTAPVVTASCATAGTQGSAYSCTPSVTDVDSGQTQTWSFAPSHTCGFASINSVTGFVSGTPTDDQVGTCTLAFRSHDGFKYSNTRSFTVTISNVAPTLTISNAPYIPYASPNTVIRVDSLVQASEEGYGVYSFDHVTTTAPRCTDNGVLTINSTTGAVSWDPNDTYQGTCNVKVTFDDGNASNNTVSAQFTATVYAPNNAPVLTTNCATSVNEDVAYACTPNISDPDGPSASWEFTSNTCAWITMNSGGTISGTPNDSHVGSCSYTYRAFDTLQYSNSITVNVTVANTAPTLTIANAPAIGYGSGAMTIRNDAAVQASDEPYGSYTLDNAGATAPRCSDNGTLTIEPTYGSIVFDPNNTYQGTCNVRVVFNDGNASVSANFTATVAGPTPGGTAIAGYTKICPDGEIMSLEPLGTDRMLMGGSFETLGECAGVGVPFNTLTGEPLNNFSIITSGGFPTINVSVPDGNGGWYVAGDFYQIGALTRYTLAHINSDGTHDITFNPATGLGNGDKIYAMVKVGNNLYFTGQFYGNGCRNFMIVNTVTQETSCPIGFDSWNYAMTADSNNVYIGGYLRRVGVPTRFGGFDGTTGIELPANVTVDNVVNDVVSDGNGGWYIGGEFFKVNGVSRNRIAHILSDGTLDTTFNPNPNGTVFSLKMAGGYLWAGGTFINIGGQSRGYIAQLDPTTGAATSFNTTIGAASEWDKRITKIDVYGSTVFIAGPAFTSAGGQSRNKLAAIDITSGLATTWNPNPAGDISALTVAGSTLYVGGTFATISGVTRNNLASYDLSTGNITSWDPNANGNINAIEIDGGTAYIGGGFTTLAGQTRNRIAAVDAISGALNSSFNPSANSNVNALTVDGSSVYVGGSFTSIGGASRSYLAVLNKSTGTASSVAPYVDSSPNSVRVYNGNIFVGGNFDIIGGVARNYVTSLKLSDHTLNYTWNPNASAIVYSLETDGTNIYAGGDFTSIGGAAGTRIAALNNTTGAQTPGFTASANNSVRVLKLSGNTLYVGGQFTSISGTARNYIGAIDKTSGALSGTFDPSPDYYVYAVEPIGTTVYVGGAFKSIAGVERLHVAALTQTGTALPITMNVGASVASLSMSGTNLYVGGTLKSVYAIRRRNLAALDTTTDTITDWNPGADGYVKDIELSGSTLYVSGGFTTLGGASRSKLGAVDVTTGLATAFNPANDAAVINSIDLAGTTLYVAGTFSSLGGQARKDVGAVNVSTGLATTWNPNSVGSSEAYKIHIDGTLAYVAGNFTSIGGQARTGIAAIDTSTALATAWNPNVNNTIYAIITDPTTVYIGGRFTTIGAASRTRIGAIDKSTGTATSWAPYTSGNVYNILYDAGVFMLASWPPSAHNNTTGAQVAWSHGIAGGQTYDIAISQNKTYIVSPAATGWYHDGVKVSPKP